MLAGTGITYKLLEDDLVVLNAAGESAPDVVTIKGKVTDASGAAIPGASITVKGTKIGVAADEAGNFTIAADPNATLVISALGFAIQEVSLKGNTNLTVSMVAASQTDLNNVVVVGYGSQRRIDVTGAVAQVKGAEISKQPVVNPISGLQGKVAGVQITNSGAPGASPEIRIRGLGTVYGDPNPLYVVDGVWFNDISFLSPSDIENISILKDASAQSIYGIRAANGVVLVTTKKGRSGKAVVTYDGFVGVQSMTNRLEMANANEYATLINELNGRQVLNPAQFGKGTDWYGQILRNAVINNHAVSLSGGGEKSTYNLSLGFLQQEGLVEKNDFKRGTIRFQNDFQVASNFKAGYTFTSAILNSRDANGGIFRELYTAYPVLPVYYEDGSYGDPADFPLGDGARYNPQATIDFFDQTSRNYRLNGSVFGEVKFLKHFNFRSSFGGEFGQSEVKRYNPVYTATLSQRNTTSVLNVNRAETRNWILENTLSYDNKFGDHSIRVFAGQSAQRYQVYEMFARAENVPNTTTGDRFLSLGDPASRNITDRGDLSTVASYFGRLNYAFQNKYLLNASIRTDGSSKFFGDDRWGYFPSVGAGWVISQERFMANQKIFNSLKLRGSWGKIGNASVPSNLSVLRVTQEDYLGAIFGGQLQPGASVNTVVPPTTVWERGVGSNIGLEATMLNNKLSAELDFYSRRTEQAIFDIPILGTLGTSSSSIVGNQATFQNQGIELSLTYNDAIGKDFSYSLSGNISANRNEVLEVSTGSNPIFAGGAAATGGALSTRTIAGQPIGQFFGRKVIGVFQTVQEVESYRSRNNTIIQPDAKPGDFKYADENEDGVIDNKDRVVLGNPNPRFSYGFNTSFSYKSFDLSLDFQGVAGVEIYNANLGLRFGSENYTKDFFDNRWRGPGTSNTYPSANIGGGTNYLPNSFYVENGSYFRIRTAQLGYTLPQALLSRFKIKKLRVFANAQNALNFFSYRGFNPEVGGRPTNAGIDANVYPLSATFNFGVNLTL
ncbi:MAG: TonB-dependent receptor [Bacteroidetes bacterium]|nr:MAG: TonB-dependent receptor [Bacteroidota bacterium]